MNASPNRWRAIATFTILASALLATLAGCTNKTSSVPAAQTPPSAVGANQANAANPAPGNPANAANTTPAAPAPPPAPQPPLVLPRGTRLEVRLNQTINVKHVESGDRFNGSSGRASSGRQHRCRALRFRGQR